MWRHVGAAESGRLEEKSAVAPEQIHHLRLLVLAQAVVHEAVGGAALEEQFKLFSSDWLYEVALRANIAVTVVHSPRWVRGLEACIVVYSDVRMSYLPQL